MPKQKQEEALPKTLFAYREVDGDDTYFVAGETRAELSDNEVRTVGTYKLVETGEQVQKPKYTRKRFVG